MNQALAVADLDAKSTTLMDQVRAIGPIRDDETYTRKCTLLVGAKSLLKEIIAEHKDAKEKADAAHKSVCAMEKRYADPVRAVIAVIDREEVAYRQEKERLRRIDTARAEEAARRREEEALLAEASAAEAAGDHDVASAILDLPVQVAPVVLPKATPKVEGMRERPLYWSAHVHDLGALIRAVAEGKVSQNALLPNETWLNAQAKDMKLTMAYPGVKAVSR